MACEEIRRLWPTGLYSPAGPPCSPVSGLWLDVFGLAGRRGLGPPVQQIETRDPSSSAIFGLSAPDHAEAARLETTETTARLLAADLGHREGGRGEGCSLEPQAHSAAPSAQCIPAPQPGEAGPGGLGEVAPSPLSPRSSCLLPYSVALRALRGLHCLLCSSNPAVAILTPVRDGGSGAVVLATEGVPPGPRGAGGEGMLVDPGAGLAGQRSLSKG